MTYKEHEKEFNTARESEDGYRVMAKCTAIINEIGKRFLELDGGELEEYRSKLLGYKFFLADIISNWQRMSKMIDIDIKSQKARMYDEITEKIKAEKGKVSNKEQIDNEFLLIVEDQIRESMFYETLYNKFKLKISAIDDALSAIMQRVKELTAQAYDSRQS